MKFNYKRTLLVSRRIVLAALVIFLVFILEEIVFGLLSQSKPQTFASEKVGGEIAEKEFRAAEYSGAKKNLVIKAENFFLDDEQNQHLEGKVEVIDESVDGKVILHADKLVISPDRKKILAEEGVEVEFGGLKLNARELEYLVDEKIARSPEAELIAENIKLRVKKLRYAIQSRMAMFEDSFSGIGGSQDNQFSLLGQNAVWEKEANFLRAEGLSIVFNRVEARGQKAEVYFSKESNDFDSIKLEGSCYISGKASDSNADFQEIRIFSERTDIVQREGQIIIVADGPFRLEGKGSKWMMNGDGENLNLDFKSSEGLERLFASRGNLRFVHGGGEENYMTGQNIEYDVLNGNVLLKKQATGKFKDYELEARELNFKLSDRSFSASEFQMMVKSGFFSGNVVLFSPDKNAYITGNKISGTPDMVVASGNVRSWQDENQLETGKLTIDRKTMNLTLEEVNYVNCLIKSGKDKTNRVYLSADHIRLLSDERKIIAEGQVAMNLNEVKVKVPQVRINLDQSDGKKLKSVELFGTLEVNWKDYLARGQKAVYQSEQDKLEVSGSPELIDREGNRVEADKLTLYLSDDRILVENLKRERSQVILVRGK